MLGQLLNLKNKTDVIWKDGIDFLYKLQ
jgi:hypothetical protein